LDGVNSSQVDHQTVIEVNPHIIISLEAKDLTSLVRETTVDLKAISVVVVHASSVS
jgi:hypothetical protein